jgi:acyl-CoA synthetase (AMP-forming)/AMP-acid ligase II
MYPGDIAFTEIIPSKKTRKDITHKQFDERVTKVANALIDLGIKKGDRVLHWMTNSVNFMEAYCGIIRAGAWVSPLNFRFSSEDLKYCADVAEAKALILGGEFAEKVQAIRLQLPTLEHYIFAGQDPPEGMMSFEDLIEKASSKPPKIEMSDEDEAALYFTSGSTGVPKALLLTHKNLESSAITAHAAYGLKHSDNCFLGVPMYHISPPNWWGSAIVGGRLTVMDTREVKPRTLFEVIQESGITYFFMPMPWVLDILGALDRKELRKDDYDLSTWRFMLVGSQPVSAGTIKRWKEYFPTMPVLNQFGMTETAGPGCVTITFGDEHKIPSIGKASLNWEARVVNDKGEDVARGEVGELILKGNGVTKGYYKNPELTAKTIRDGWLYTGDLVRKDRDGYLYIVDRKKDVVISGGENIYPADIESVLITHPKVYDVGVIGIPDERLGEIVAAVIEPKPGKKVTGQEMRAFLEPRLAKYKWPRRIIITEKLPRTAVNKIDKPRLRQVFGGVREAFRVG